MSLRVMVQWKCVLLSSSLIAVLIVPLHSPSLSTSLPLMIVQVCRVVIVVAVVYMFLSCAVTPEDYVDRDRVLDFAACDRTVCVIVPIVNDIVLEDVERFDVAIRPPAGGLDSRITLDPTDGIVEIIDDGGLS